MSEENQNITYRAALYDFHSARQRAAVEEILARLAGRSTELLSYQDVARTLRVKSSAERGRQNIPLSAIVGSVGRYHDFTRSFLPRNPSDEDRWARVKASLTDSQAGWPPIDVYKIGEFYFVLDGNHRVSVARQDGWTTIEANVIEVKTKVPFSPEVEPDDLIRMAEYAEFIDQTSLDDLRPDANLNISLPGQYPKLLEHIEVHRYFMGLDYKRDISYPEAVTHWYDTVYLPVTEIIRERGLLRWFPNRTEADLYLWLSEHRAALQAELGWEIPPAAAADQAVRQKLGAESTSETGAWRKSRLLDRYTETLFQNILVSVSGEPEGWAALHQAVEIARREGANLLGLHVYSESKPISAQEQEELQAQFSHICREAGVGGSLAVESGEPARKILERAILADLVALKISYPPSAGIGGLASPLRAILARSPRPVLALPGSPTDLSSAALAFDGSPKAKEALFIAAYLAERWQTPLTVFTGADSPSAQDYARQYLELHEVQATYLLGKPSAEALRQFVAETKPQLLLMGGYSGAFIKELTIGSTVDAMLRHSPAPILICR